MPMLPIHAENSAGLAIEIVPGTQLHIGEKITIRASTRKAGYLMLLDVDADGKVTQIYPNVRSLMTRHAKRENANRIEPGRTVMIPNPRNPYSGFELVASPPTGVAMIVGILSGRPVQIIDLPNVPAAIVSQGRAFQFLQNATRQRLIASADNGASLRATHWSFDAKYYVIR